MSILKITLSVYLAIQTLRGGDEDAPSGPKTRGSDAGVDLPPTQSDPSQHVKPGEAGGHAKRHRQKTTRRRMQGRRARDMANRR